MEELTKKQRAILDYMKAHVAEHTYWPSIRDIQAKFRFASTNAVFGHLQGLECASGSWGCFRRETLRPWCA